MIEELVEQVLARLHEKGLKKFPEGFKNRLGQLIVSLQNTFPWNSDEEIINQAVEEILKRINDGTLDFSEYEIQPIQKNRNSITQEIKRNQGGRQEELPFQKVYEWACRLTTEQGEEEFFWTPETKALVFRLKHTKGNMIAVIGLQGSGKTALRQAIQKQLFNEGFKVYSLKWIGDPKEAISEAIRNIHDGFLDEFDEDYFIELFSTFLDSLGERRIFQLATQVCKKLKIDSKKHSAIESLIKNFDKDSTEGREVRHSYAYLIPLIERKLGRKIVEHIRRRAFLDKLQTAHTILIDLPDYDRSNIRQMTKDLTAIQDWWENVFTSAVEGYSQNVNLVLFFQKELFHGHFFMGKLDIFELRPYTPQHLIGCYRGLFGSTEPFTEEALNEIAILSRGIFRRFKKYIRICLENYYQLGNHNSITPNLVRKWITLEQQEKDMELELMTIFPKQKELRKLSVILLRKLREKGPISQSKIANEIFDGAKMKCSRVLDRLEAWNYIKREWKGKEKIVSLKEWR